MRQPTPPRSRQIITLMNCVQDYGRRALEGIARYANAHHPGQWRLALMHIEQVQQKMPRLTPDVAGIIAHAYAPRLIEQLAACGVPVVNTSGVAPSPTLPGVLPDNAAIGRMAAEDLTGRGHRRLVAYEVAGSALTRERRLAFTEAATSAGATVQELRLRSWKRAEPDIAAMLRQTPTPVGIFAGNDGLAVITVRQCQALGMAIPEQVAILGVDNDTLTTNMMEPTISSIDMPWEKLGFEAASRVDLMIRGQTPEPHHLFIAPNRVMTRQTTDGHAIEDPDVALIVHHIREHAGQMFTIDQLVELVPASRRSLEQRFKRALGRTLQDHITRVRLERAKRLLTETDYAMPEIAHRSGFSNAAYFATVFRQHTRQTPTAFRSLYRLA